MKFAYLILAHKDPEHLERLIHALSTSNSHFFIHIDKKSNMRDFDRIKGNNIHFIKKRVAVHYDYSMLKAILRLLRFALDFDIYFNYFIHLAGVDYPIQLAIYIEHFLEQYSGKEFLEILPTPSGEQEFPVIRLAKYEYLHNSSLIERVFHQLYVKFNFSKDRLKEFQSFSIAPYWGSSFWALTRNACEYIRSFVTTNPKIMKFMRNTHYPEEMLFQIILGNSPFMGNIVNNLHFVDWSLGTTHPPELSEKHIDFFSKSIQVIQGEKECLFARKFCSRNGVLVDKLDEMIDEKEKIFLERHGDNNLTE